MIFKTTNLHRGAAIALALPALVLSTHTQAQCPGDLDIDGVVGIADFTRLLVGFGQSDDEDIDLDGDFNLSHVTVQLDAP